MPSVAPPKSPSTAGFSLSGASPDAVAGALSAFTAGLAASLGVPASQLTVSAPTAGSRRRSLLQAAGAAASEVAFSVAIDPLGGGLGAKSVSLSSGIASASAGGAGSPLYASLQQAGLSGARAAVAKAPAVTVGCAVAVPVASSSSGGGGSAQAAQALSAALQPGGAVEAGLVAAIGPVFSYFAGEASVILPPPLPPPAPSPPPLPPPSPRPPIAPLPPAAPADKFGCDLQPCFPGVSWCVSSPPSSPQQHQPRRPLSSASLACLWGI